MAAFNFHRRQTRRWWYVGATLMAVAFFSVFYVVGASATLAGSNFDASDGNMVVDANSTYTDWCTDATAPVPPALCAAPFPGLNTATDQPSGSGDNAFGQGTKEDSPNVTVVDGSIPPNKNDLTNFMEASQTIGTGSSQQVFLYLGWERLVNIGNANLDFEINQNSTSGWTGTTTGKLTINRTAGDMLVTYDFGGSGTPTLGLNRWLTSATNPTIPGFSTNVCLSSNTFPCWGDHKDLTGTNAEGAVNTGTITDPIFGGSLGTGLFGEAAINLTGAGVFTPGQCESFGSAFLKSRSSSSFTAEIKDFISPIPVDISNCGEVIVRKVTSPANIDKSFSYTSNLPTTSDNPVTSSSSPYCQSTNNPTSFSLNDKSFTITGITAATQAVVTTSTANNFTVGQRVTISGSNSTPSIDGDQIVTAVSNGGKSFTISAAVTVAGTSGSVVGNNEDCLNVTQGSYHVAETTDANYTLSNIDCTNSSTDNGSTIAYSDGTTTGSSFSAGDNQINFDLKPGDKIDCTYTNTLNQGALLINKNSAKTGVAVLNAGAIFCYSTSQNCTGTSGAGTVTDLGPTGTVGTTGDQSLTTGVICVAGLTPGTYYVNETQAPTGYAIGSSGQQTATVTTGTNCGSNLPTSTTTSNTGKVTFTDPPLFDVIIAYRDGGSGETSIASGTPMACTADNSTGTDATTGTGFGTPSGWTTSDAIKGVKVTSSSNVTVTCTAVVDP